ncbi:MAG: hypothetical protein K6G68_00890 [Oscillospiraceae bacterium]|nr:hypothetical protein [Oscillospiraceae bacterium]
MNRNKATAAALCILFCANTAACGNVQNTTPETDTLPSSVYSEVITDNESITSSGTEEVPETVISSESTVSDKKTTITTTAAETSVTTVSETEVPETTVTTVSAETTVSESILSQPAVTTLSTTVTTVPVTRAAFEVTKPANVKTMTYAEYFSRSLFVGDSICSGLKVFGGLLPVENVCARGNVGTWSLNNYTFPYRSGSREELDTYSIAKLYQPEDIYVWMGMNDLYVVTEEKFVQNLTTITNNFHQYSPNSRLHVVSISPISRNHRWNYNNCNGSNKINRYNAAAANAFSTSDYVDWIDINTALSDEYGFLASSYSSGDGLHIGVKAYQTVLNTIIAYNNEHLVNAATEMTYQEITTLQTEADTEDTSVTTVTVETEVPVTEISETTGAETSVTEISEDITEETTSKKKKKKKKKETTAETATEDMSESETAEETEASTSAAKKKKETETAVPDKPSVYTTVPDTDGSSAE